MSSKGSRSYRVGKAGSGKLIQTKVVRAAMIAKQKEVAEQRHKALLRGKCMLFDTISLLTVDFTPTAKPRLEQDIDMDFGSELATPDEPIPLDDRDSAWEDVGDPGDSEDTPSNEGELFQHFLGEE
jgi:hypothetical protein